MTQTTKPVEFIDPNEPLEADVIMDVEASKRWRRDQIAIYEAMHSLSSEEFLKRWLAFDIKETFETNAWAMLLLDKDWE
jgi:hypothetical protein